MNPRFTRRQFLRSSTAATAGLAFASPALVAASRPAKLRVLSIGVVGTIGEADRKQVASHPDAVITGLCDVDSTCLAQATKDHPDAFVCRDYREAFEHHGDRFDAVIVATPDHTHAPILLTAMAHDKHVYGQKPLVHQLEELVMVEKAIAAKPSLSTQLGNQRMASAGRRAAVEILRRGMLGKAIEAYAWVDSPADNFYFNFRKESRPLAKPPANLDWNLWLGPNSERPYDEFLAPRKWRSWWEFGTNGLGDWGCHLLDVIFFAYDELQSPISVRTDCAKPAGPIFHSDPCASTITYQVNSPHFARDRFCIHYQDSNQRPSPDRIAIPERITATNTTVVVCEGGTLYLEADGRLRIWRNGKLEEGLRMKDLPKFPPINHWHEWVDHCLGRGSGLRAPFKDAVRMTEATLLAVKASRFPGLELQWDKNSLSFPNSPEATKSIVRRSYREGFAPPTVA